MRHHHFAALWAALFVLVFVLSGHGQGDLPADAIVAVRSGDVKGLEKLLSGGLKAEARVEKGIPLLVTAAGAGHLDAVNNLLSRNRDQKHNVWD